MYENQDIIKEMTITKCKPQVLNGQLFIAIRQGSSSKSMF